MDFPQNPNQPLFSYFSPTIDFSGFEELLMLNQGDVDSIGGSSELDESGGSLSTDQTGSATGSAGQEAFAAAQMRASSSMQEKCKDGVMKRGSKADGGARVAFRTKSDLEILDDGFKWRKYGKKMVKNSPNPRNYYRCSTRGCHVKKRVEREKDDPSYVLTTYEGVHNHESPCILYFNQMPINPSSSSSNEYWTLQPASSHS